MILQTSFTIKERSIACNYSKDWDFCVLECSRISLSFVAHLYCENIKCMERKIKKLGSYSSSKFQAQNFELYFNWEYVLYFITEYIDFKICYDTKDVLGIILTLSSF